METRADIYAEASVWFAKEEAAALELTNSRKLKLTSVASIKT
jgi:hypothetical protein